MNLNTDSLITVELHCDDIALKVFQQLFQGGVILQVQVGVSVRDVLCRQLEIADEYVDNRVNTIFLNSMPVDDIDTATVSDRTVLALSASMPGLAGAVMRKGGFFAGLRSTISYSEGKVAPDSGTGELVLKLYNMTASEVGPHILERGVLIEVDKLREFFAERVQRFWEGCSQALVDGKQCSIGKLRSLEWPEKTHRITLRVIKQT
jgi:hypothetical protein